MPEYIGEYSWILAAENPGFSNRTDHAAASFKGKLWVLGGYNSGAFLRDTYMEDVWCSADGKEWSQVTADAPWKGRRGHAVIVFNDNLYLLGGYSVDEATGYRDYYSDVWKSSDGIVWEEVTSAAPWTPRFEHAVVQANHSGTDYIYLLGGCGMKESEEGRYTMDYFSDVWRTSDGDNWTQLTPSQDYGNRASLAAVTDPSTNRIYLHGGQHQVTFDDGADGILNGRPTADWDNLWYTDDGTNWLIAEPIPDPRADHRLEYYDGRIWMLPGKKDSNVHYGYTNPGNYEFYYYDDSVWTRDSEGSGVGARHGYASVLHDGKLWIIGGITADSGPDNDVWAGEIL